MPWCLGRMHYVPNRPWHVSPRNLQYATISIVICVTGRTALLSLLLTPLWLEGSAGFGGKRKSAVKPAHSKIFPVGGHGLFVSSPLGWAFASPVTQSVMRPCCQVGRGLCLWAIFAALRLDPPRTSSGAPRIRTRRTGLSRPTFCRTSAPVTPQPHPPRAGSGTPE